MARGPSRPWKRLAPHTEAAFAYVRAAIQYGYDVELPITEVAQNEMADFRRGLFNAAKHLGVSLHCHPKKQPDGTYTLMYAVHSKSVGRKHVLEKYGKDRRQWAYNPREASPRDDDGKRTDI
ncbi:MAG: hypothetical protein JWP34_5043 [Massilia sp.]|jgi:hypothetical protein|nr:hypothetical protein [Massilia sp.]